MKGMKIECYGSFSMPDSYQEVSIDWPTVTLKYDKSRDQALLTQGSWGEADSLLRNIEHKLDLIRPDEITEKTRIKV